MAAKVKDPHPRANIEHLWCSKPFAEHSSARAQPGAMNYGENPQAPPTVHHSVFLSFGTVHESLRRCHMSVLLTVCVAV